MKHYFHFSLSMLLLSLTLWACQSNSNSDEGKVADTQSPADSLGDAGELNEHKSLVLPYIAEVNDQTAAVYLKENPQRSQVPLTKDELAEALNIKYPEIYIEAGEEKSDTLYVSIPEATFLTQQSGTTGAQTYLAEATFAFTELPKIHVVFFKFQEGDHALPGAYTRSSFKKI